jgi:16S rRNA (guanine1207-N2)-methyltransferase
MFASSLPTTPDDLLTASSRTHRSRRQGRAARLFTSWLGRLAPNASSWWVVHKHLGSDSLAAWIGANGWDVTRLTSQRGYRILEVSGR